MVGLELDEEVYPSTHMPRSMLIVNFYTLSLLTAQDRFSLQYAIFHCLARGRPWDCKPTSILDELLWEPVKYPAPFDKWFPDARWWNDFWWTELDLSNTGNNLLHNLVIQNTNIKCLQKNPFFSPNSNTNPIVCYNKPNPRLRERKYGNAPPIEAHDEHDHDLLHHVHSLTPEEEVEELQRKKDRWEARKVGFAEYGKNVPPHIHKKGHRHDHAGEQHDHTH